MHIAIGKKINDSFVCRLLILNYLDADYGKLNISAKM